MDVSSFVVTLGTGTLLIGLAQFVSGSNIVSVNSPQLSALAIHEVLGMPVSFYYGLVARRRPRLPARAGHRSGAA